MSHRVAVDVGGTFIDFVLLDETTGTVTIEKQPSTPDRLVDELLAGLARLEVPAADVHQLFHGTTVAINAVLQERGARVGLLTTAGFRDVLAIGRGNRPEIYNFLYRAPQPLVPRHLRREVPERLAADGSDPHAARPGRRRPRVRRPRLAGSRGDRDLLPARVREPDARGGRGGAHPRAASSGHRLPPRTRSPPSGGSTSARPPTVLNAFVQPLFAGYLARLQAGLAGVGYTRSLALMQSNGGVIGADRARATADQDTRVGAGRRRDRLPGPRTGAPSAERHLRGCGRYQLRRRPDRRRPDPRADGDEDRAPPDRRPDDRHRLDWRRGRLDRVDRPQGRAPGRAAERRRLSRAGLLRSRRHRADGDRLSPPARQARPGELPGRAMLLDAAAAERAVEDDRGPARPRHRASCRSAPSRSRRRT